MQIRGKVREMKLKLFKRRIKSEFGEADLPRVCRFCERATLINDEDNVLCSVKGIVFADYCCRKFSYDPLKREPKMPPPIPKPDLSAVSIDLPLFMTAEQPNAQETGPASGEPATSAPRPAEKDAADTEAVHSETENAAESPEHDQSKNEHEELAEV
jgi:hypothetical protein